MAGAFKINRILSREHRAEYEALARDGRETGERLMGWLHERGYAISKKAVLRHRRNFQEMLEGVRRSAELAAAFALVGKEYGLDSLSQASLGRLEQLLMEKLFAMEAESDLETNELAKLASAMNGAASARQRRASLEEKYEERERRAIEAAQQAVRDGAGSEAVVSKIREILGMPVLADQAGQEA